MSGIWGLRERACAKTKARMEQDMGFAVMAWGVGACVCVWGLCTQLHRLSLVPSWTSSAGCKPSYVIPTYN